MLEVKIPEEFLELCENWHSGQSSMFYAVSSTGSLRLGTHRPIRSEDNEPMTDKEWMQVLLDSLESEIRDCLRITKGENTEDRLNFEAFEKFVENELEKFGSSEV